MYIVMYMYMIYIYITCVRAFVCIYVYLCMYEFVCMCAHANLYACMYANKSFFGAGSVDGGSGIQEQLLRRNVKRFEAHRLVYHSTLGLKVMKMKKKKKIRRRGFRRETDHIHIYIYICTYI